MAGKRINRGGRRARLAQRVAKAVLAPCPPSQTDGMHRPLTETDIQRIYTTALDLLENLGMLEVADKHDLDVNTAYALNRNTTKLHPRRTCRAHRGHAGCGGRW